MVALLAGLAHLQDISRSAHPLDQDALVAQVWSAGMYVFANQWVQEESVPLLHQLPTSHYNEIQRRQHALRRTTMNEKDTDEHGWTRI